MHKLLFILLSWSMCLPFQATGAEPVSQARIIGGIETAPNELPWQAYLNMTFRDSEGARTFICGGVVISPVTVITAAHCMRNGQSLVAPEDVEVWAGITSIFSATSASAVRVESIVIHPNYNSTRFSNDIAVLKLAETLPDSARPIQLATSGEQAAADLEFANGWVDNAERVANLLVSGWGSTSVGDSSSGSTRLRQTLLSGVPDSRCDGMWGSSVTANDYSIYVCAGSTAPELARDSCFGDSGGPLVWQNPQAAGDSDFGLRLVGLVSFGEGCAGRLPGVYTQVATYRNWLTSEVGGSLFTQVTPEFSRNPFTADYSGAGQGIPIAQPVASGGGSSGGGTMSIWVLCGLMVLACRRRGLGRA